jgi:TPR repeat protein
VTFTIDFPRDDAHAYKWLILAARGGHAKARSRLAELSKTITAADEQRGEQLLENWRTGPCGPPMISG